VWTYSRFSAARISAAVERPVLVMPPPVGPRVAVTPRCTLPDGFRVLVMFDFLSTLARKNPLGAITAYREAFRAGGGAGLVIKSINGRHRPDRREEIMAAIGGRPDVVLIDETMSSSERYGLIDACDCVLSLHRSEGHGLVLAEAMAAGKPVVATDYGGNAEFMSIENSYPVPWRLTQVGPAVEHYPAEASWAEPDIAEAARLLRDVRDHPQEAARRVHYARLTIERTLAPRVVGAHMRRRLEDLGDTGARVPRYLAQFRARLRRHSRGTTTS
jgi:glycosyltransferase involved in cell wall biosynthesis